MFKKYLLSFLACLLILTAACTQSYAENYLKTYANSRYAFKVDVPKHMLMERPSDNGDGFSFYDKKSGMKIAAYGAYNVLEKDAEQLIDESIPKNAQICRRFGEKNKTHGDYIAEYKDSQSYYISRVVMADKGERVIWIRVSYPLSKAEACIDYAKGTVMSLIVSE